ncbi:MAG: DegT/DnrJ/EryC1/StrS family aminotransferase [Actinomycetota bacterium]
MLDRIPVARPNLDGNEEKYVLDCVRTSWISSNGEYIARFEEAFAERCGTRHAVATNNGTTALHLALVALGVGAGDEVIVPTVTFVATANAVRYCGAEPVLVDVQPGTLNIDPLAVEAAITERTKAIIPVHLYGHPAEMTAIMEIAERHHLAVVEDAAEAHGAAHDGRPVGSIGHCGTFSFFGNKIITTGEGGMVTTNDDELARRLRLYRGQGLDPARRYWFVVVGFNYRMTNIEAAIGLAQLETMDAGLATRAKVARWYDDALAPLDDLLIRPAATPGATSVCWMYNVFLRHGDVSRRDEVMARLDERGIETRPVFHPMHHLPPYRDPSPYPVADDWACRGISLPTHELLTPDDIERVTHALSEAVTQPLVTS